jgi:hypothetical protein
MDKREVLRVPGVIVLGHPSSLPEVPGCLASTGAESRENRGPVRTVI